MELILWIVLGSLTGWLGSLVEERCPTRATLITNVLVGAVGAVLGGLFLLPVVIPNELATSMAGALTATIAAVLVLAFVNLCRSSKKR